MERIENSRQRTNSRFYLGIFLLLIGLLVAFLISLAFGSVSIPIEEIFQLISGGEPKRKSWEMIVIEYRLPKALCAFAAGAALSISGLLMQTYFQNPLAGPFVLGISSGASLGVAIAIMLLDPLGLTTQLGRSLSSLSAACLGAFIVMAVILVLSRRMKSPTVLLLVGLMFGYASGGLVNLIVYLSEARQIQSFLIWSFGSFSRVSWELMLWFLAPIGICLGCAALQSKPLNALQLGEGYAQSLGISIPRIRLIILFLSSLLAGVVTAFCGPIAFIGIAVPHLTRGLFRSSDHRVLIPASILMGGILCLLADLGSQLPGMEETLPLNSITSLLGAPVVIWILTKSKKRGSMEDPS